MNISRSLTFLATPWSIGASVVGVVVTAAYCFAAWRRSGYQKSLGILELLRLTIVCLAAILFNQPEWIEEYRPEEKPSVAVLWDASPSMETRDVSPTGQTTTQPVSRHDAILSLTDQAAWKNLDEKLKVFVEPFSPPLPGRGSD